MLGCKKRAGIRQIKGLRLLNMVPCPSAFLAFSHGIFVPRGCRAAKDLLEANHYLTYAKGCSNLCCRFRDLTRRCFPSAPANAVRCYELMCVHVGLVPVQFATKHIRSLASALFQTSLGANYPISLIQWRHAFVITFVLVSYWYRSSPFHRKRSSRTCKLSKTTRGLNIYLHFLRCFLNPLSPNSDQDQFSPNDIRTLSRD